MGRRNIYSLAKQLDREVYAAIQTYLNRLRDTGGDQQSVSTLEIYKYVKNSNSSLGRKSKASLEDSIERVLESIKDQLSESSQSGESSLVEQDENLRSGNEMNRHLAQSWKFNTNSKEMSNSDPSPLSAPYSNSQQKRPVPPSGLDDTPTVRSPQSNQRPPKRPKTSSNTTDAMDSLKPPTHVSFDDLGGMNHIIARLEELVLLPLCRPAHYIERGLKMPHGILFHGPPGCGKTLLCEAIAAEMELPFLSISAPSIVSGMSGESEKALREHFNRAIEVAPCIMFIDEIDAVTPKRESAQREMERRIVAQLLTCMDDLDISKTGGKPVFVLAATNRPDSLDPSLRRAGRFDVEINVGVPNAQVRAQILGVQTRKTKVAEDVDFDALAQSTPGFVGADLESLVYAAGNISNRRYLEALRELSERNATPEAGPLDKPQCASSSKKSQEVMDVEIPLPTNPNPSRRFRRVRRTLLTSQTHDLPSTAITQSDFLTALPSVQPSSMREGFATVPTVSFASIGALHAHRTALTSAIIAPILSPSRYARFQIHHPAGILLYGPPGCGKTLLARAVANESKANFISVKGPELMNKYVGESERAVRTLFQRARHSQPVIVFFDELDALVPRRSGAGSGAEGEAGGSAISEASSRVVNTLLVELDGAAREGGENGVYVIAASNRPEAIDPAMLRSGRLGKHLYVGLPTAAERGEIIATLLKDMPVRDATLNDMKVYAESANCGRFSGADLEVLVRESAMCAVERGSDWLEVEDVVRAVADRGVKATVGVGEAGGWERLGKQRDERD